MIVFLLIVLGLLSGALCVTLFAEYIDRKHDGKNKI